jgi:hypothetical protein
MSFLVAFLNRLLTSAFGQAVLGIGLAKNKRLCAELIWRAYRDQRARKVWSKPHHRRTVQRLQRLIRLDLSNTRRLKQIVAQHGWPGQSLVGPIGEQAAWLLAQHADHDLAFQQYCLPLLERAVQNQEASPANWAYLIDRVRVAEGHPQVYGTQFHGALRPLPIEDATRVDERRAEVGLPPLAEYIEQMHKAQAQQPPWSEWSTEMKRLLEQLLPSAEYEEYVLQLKRLFDTTTNS